MNGKGFTFFWGRMARAVSSGCSFPKCRHPERIKYSTERRAFRRTSPHGERKLQRVQWTGGVRITTPDGILPVTMTIKIDFYRGGGYNGTAVLQSLRVPVV